MTHDHVDSDQLTSGYKADENKIRLELIPPELIFSVGTVLTFGAKKYRDRNWEIGMKWSRPFGAAMRHLWAWWAGKGPTSQNFLFGSTDSETGFSHLWHAGCCIAFLIAYEDRRMTVWDDRFKVPDPIHVPDASGARAKVGAA